MVTQLDIRTRAAQLLALLALSALVASCGPPDWDILPNLGESDELQAAPGPCDSFYNGDVYFPSPLYETLSDYCGITGDLTINAGDYGSYASELEDIRDVNGTVSISGFGDLDQIPVLGRLRSVGRDLRVQGNGVKSLASLRWVERVGGELVICTNSRLRSIDALYRLNTVGRLTRICKNPELENLDGLESLESVYGDLRIHNNGKLSSLGLGDLQRVDGEVQVCSNGAGAQGEVERLAQQLGKEISSSECRE